jgi:hypothetical protein
MAREFTMTRLAMFPAVFLFFMVVAMRSAHAGPSLVNYQGVLRDAGGTPRSGNYDMTFRFFNAASGGEEILVDRHTAALLGAVTVSGGLFDVALGGGSVSDGSGSGTYGGLDAVFDNYQDVWLEVAIGTETLAPRTKIAAVPYAIDATNAESADASTNANNAWMLNNQAASYYVDTSSTRQIKSGALALQSTYSGASALDVIANGSAPMAVWAQNDDGSLCKLATGAHALECSAYAFQTYAGYFENTSTGANVELASGPYGVMAEASFGPGWFHNTSTGAVVYVAKDSYKVQGTGSVSFVQNVPRDPGHVIVYAAPEGDEVAVYTRGSGRLSGGEARVTLGPTFAQVANPDVGLTATVTPRGAVPVALSVESVATDTLVVRGPTGSDVAFDYTVWGLRIGFESQSIVQPKEFEAKIPSMKEHAARFAAEPALREYTAVARFRKSEAEAFGRAATETPRADALLAAVGVFPGVVPVRPPKGEAAVSAAPEATAPSVETVAVAATTAIARRHDDDSGIVVLLTRQATDEGSVVSLDPDAPGYVRPSTEARDPLIIGCASASDDSAFGQLPVATSRIALCRVDATYGRIDVGDRLVASPTSGHAMRDDGSIKEATVLGRAIDPLASGAGLIRVLVAVR